MFAKPFARLQNMAVVSWFRAAQLGIVTSTCSVSGLTSGSGDLIRKVPDPPGLSEETDIRIFSVHVLNGLFLISRSCSVDTKLKKNISGQVFQHLNHQEGLKRIKELR